MHHKHAMALTLVVGATLAGLSSVHTSGLADIPVTTLVSDYDSGVAPALQIQSDKLGVYTNSRTLTSILTSFGTWALDSYNARNATRTVSLQFSQPIPGTGPNGGAPVAPASGDYEAFLYTSCNHPNYASSMLTLPPGQTMPCPMAVRFAAGGKTYVLHMNSRDVKFPETDSVSITCIYPTSGTSPCSQWRIRPSGSYVAPDGTMQFRNVARLSQETTSKGQTVLITQGNFYFSFSIIVMNP